ncbi:type I-C CRISPR-associated protein Cas8c/Csd1 [Viridibacillus sp. YIM B01967]|uniref:Type I-C CRISPR-associated protein Cas8c/Csd1 n=1 Tax=Viridibacillus soli TaxID=2798301 RepID=A0ABS1HAL1_9BACL|nr:type I-C CRISPR-associated protein Cas8c/Csd1 [Viridibacillus soli]MBK3496457.1 type I-C CRISPR-associated protein Cas8c/Csd1 [Viridibacillus soli]
MSYLRALYETYENNLDKAGEIEPKITRDGKKMIEYTLLPISHTTQTAHIEVTVDMNGDLFEAKVLDKVSVILPFTEESGSRAGKNYVPHMLHDKLMFVAGDFVQYTGQEDKKEGYQKYIKQLQAWCESPYNHPDINTIYKYVKKGTLIQDLISSKILHIDGLGKLLKKWSVKSEEPKPEIFSVLTGDQESAFVRFNVHHPGAVTDDVWKNKDIFKSYIDFYNTKLKDSDICYVTGDVSPIVERHPNKLRNSGDKAKLISGNDSSGFTFRGRFMNTNEVANISYDVSQKAHNALKWLIDKQGRTIDGRVFLVWGSKNIDVPQVSENLADSSNSILLNLFELPKDNKTGTRSGLANKYTQLLSGIGKNIDIKLAEESKVYILTIDAATPGRLAVLNYRDLDINEYFERLLTWHDSCSWRHMRKVENEWKEFYGSPSFYTIAHAAYGPRPSDKVVKGVMERLLPCVMDGRQIPLDIVQNAIQRASNPLAFEGTWEWQQALSVACSIVKKQCEGEDYTVALDKTNTERDYLYGRLLAVADVLERNALGKEENRPTNAIRYMNAFARNPERTWSTIQANLQPYIMKLREKGTFFTKLIDEIGSQFNYEEFNNKSLSGKYLLGFYSQRQDLYTKKDKAEEGERTI